MPPAVVSEPAPREEKRGDKLAKEFVRWCFSFGADFPNAPDLINFRAWAAKTKLKFKDAEENEALIEARRLYLKKIEQMTRRAEAPMLASSPDGD